MIPSQNNVQKYRTKGHEQVFGVHNMGEIYSEVTNVFRTCNKLITCYHEFCFLLKGYQIFFNNDSYWHFLVYVWPQMINSYLKKMWKLKFDEIFFSRFRILKKDCWINIIVKRKVHKKSTNSDLITTWPNCELVKFIYSEKATKFCEVFTLLLSYVVPVKSKVKISQNVVSFSEYMNFNNTETTRYASIIITLFNHSMLCCHKQFCLYLSHHKDKYW